MSNHRAEKSGFAREAQMKSLEMAQSLSDEEMQNVFDTNGSRKRQYANKRASVVEDSGDHSTDQFNLVSMQNVDFEGENSVNIDEEVVNSVCAHNAEDDSALSDSQRREVAQVSRLGACRPLSVIAQETDKRKIDNLPAPALPEVISSRSSEGHSQTTGSKFAQIPSADLSRQEDYSQTTDLYPNRSTDHHSSACLQKCNDTKKEVAQSEIRSASEASLWDDPRTPGIVNIREIDHYTQKEVAALKEEAERNSGGRNQAPENIKATPAVASEEDSSDSEEEIKKRRYEDSSEEEEDEENDEEDEESTLLTETKTLDRIPDPLTDVESCVDKVNIWSFGRGQSQFFQSTIWTTMAQTRRTFTGRCNEMLNSPQSSVPSPAKVIKPRKRYLFEASIATIITFSFETTASVTVGTFSCTSQFGSSEGFPFTGYSGTAKLQVSVFMRGKGSSLAASIATIITFSFETTASVTVGTFSCTSQFGSSEGFPFTGYSGTAKLQVSVFMRGKGSSLDSDVIAVSGIKKREVTYCGKKWMIPISEPISDRKMGLKWCLNISQNHPCFQNNEIPVFVIPLIPRQTYIEFQGAVPVSDDGDQITFESEADTYANRLLGYTTDPLTIIDQTEFEIDNLRLGGPVSLIEQDTDQQTTCIHPLRTAQNESHLAVSSRGNDQPTPALHAVCSNMSIGLSSLRVCSLVDEEQSPSETGSTSRELCSLSDTHGIPELCHIRMADHNHSSPQLTSTGTQNDVAALKEPKEVNATKNPITVSAHDETNEESATMYPAYKDNHTRRVSFKESSNNVQNTTKMADCGFFYAGFGDCVCCFHCGVKLQHWQGEDDPWIEHVRYSPECRYVRMMKGDKFISLVKMAVKREEAERNSGGGNQAPENNEAAPAVPSEEGHKTTGNTKSEQSQKDPQKIKREHRELRDDTLCKICMENTISVVFLPCGHRVTCPDCAPAMRKCPICGTLIKGIVKTFYG